VIPGNPAKLGLIDEDEPRHTEKRSLINRGFTPRMVRIWEDMFLAITKETLDKVASKGECDFVEDIAVPLPLLLIADMIGIRREDRERFHVWSDAMIGAQGNFHVPEIVEAAGQAFGEYAAYLTEVIEDRRENPKDDLISILVGAHEQGILSDFDGKTPVSQVLDGMPEHQSLNRDELIMMCVLLLVAGNETTRNGLSGGMQLLIENPGERKKLIDDPSLIPDAVEEMLRLTSPVLSFCRTATQDTELHGKKIEKGQQVLMLYPSANRDSAEFDDPDAFRIDRKPHHLAFGIGNHFCLGANLARMEMRVAMVELLRRMPDMEFAAGGPEFGPSALVRSVKHMHVRYTPEIA
jgi:cytochrome P450 family 142 subfamily A polypeptide 1